MLSRSLVVGDEKDAKCHTAVDDQQIRISKKRQIAWLYDRRR